LWRNQPGRSSNWRSYHCPLSTRRLLHVRTEIFEHARVYLCLTQHDILTSLLSTSASHAPRCWKGWHGRCDNPPSTLELRDAWKAMEAVAGLDHTAKRIGLSNVHPNELLDVIQFVQNRIEAGETDPPPRVPDVLQAYSDPIHTAGELRKICSDHGIEFVSYSTLGTQHRNVAENPVLTSMVVQRLAEKHSRSVAEVVLSWALQNDMVSAHRYSDFI
jgi:diketogulonate reductase-like aldo/keto reductase